MIGYQFTFGVLIQGEVPEIALNIEFNIDQTSAPTLGNEP